MPSTAADVVSIVTDRLKQAKEDNGEKLTVELRDQRIHLPVISMPVDLLLYNPDTHRIRAQRTIDPEKNKVLAEDPWGKEGQAYLEKLLRSQPSDPDRTDPDFETLRDDVEQFGQQQPGLITQEGILVNGNTRCAALRELGLRHIRVAVLPPDTGRDDVNAVELSLQLRKENKRDYSYINQLIAMDEQLAQGRKPEDIAKEFRIQVQTLERDRWVYSLIQDAISRSALENGDSLRLIDFEDHQEKLRELHRAYVKEVATNRDTAESLKESRLAMIVLGFSKTDVRLAKPDFHQKYLVPKLPENLKSDKVADEAPIAIPGIPVTVRAATSDVQSVKALTDKLLRAKASAQSPTALPTDESHAVIAALHSSIDRALEPAGKDERLRQRKVAAGERISDAADQLDLAAKEIAAAMATKAVDQESLDEALVLLRKSLGRLARITRKAATNSSAGVDWLLRVEEDSAQ
ncbi:ParB/RepB/Spo0J family partition protein [Herbiconiux sp. CPCC 205763]|uniref:ParB/RepB/Spo0J family partition protein n=1 Tax=Herbiconiux aconitum TaxID=2970913 RepID=A0ABT2GUX6_9MICO|nr:ParB/RepB/Spo0J family partition protein [Herbiconiux aconitum]MCS5720026.1 ParB/RepB/Spo0J family partition protein [Herbiconiux aconitum]